MIKLLYKPLSILVSVVGGVVAGIAFKQVWKLIADEEEPPKATQSEYGWRDVLVAAALQGAIFGFIKAAIDRGSAVGVRKLTGTWPGD